ncbi:MAG: response regulator [Alphaproteobacteria bacterium]
MTRILIVDDHLLFGDMLKEFVRLIDSDAEIDVASGFAAAERQAKGASYDLVLMDLNMPGISGMGAFEKLKAIQPEARIAIVSGQTRLSDMRAALKAGAVGYLPKTMSSQQFVAALRLMLAEGRYIPDALISEEAANSDQEPQSLTPREREVLDALMGGRSNIEIADLLELSEATVKMHMQHIFQKLGARNRGDAIRIGLQRAQS